MYKNDQVIRFVYVVKEPCKIKSVNHRYFGDYRQPRQILTLKFQYIIADSILCLFETP